MFGVVCLVVCGVRVVCDVFGMCGALCFWFELFVCGVSCVHDVYSVCST